MIVQYLPYDSQKILELIGFFNKYSIAGVMGVLEIGG
jgi:hypothetical protein